MSDYMSTMRLGKDQWTSLTRRASSEGHVLPGSNRSIDARSIVTLIFFFLISKSTSVALLNIGQTKQLDILVIWPIYIPLPLFFTRLYDRFLSTRVKDGEGDGERRMYFKLGLETAPVLGCLILLASTCIPGRVITDGIVGSEGVRPYDIMTLFISFVSLSPLFVTGRCL
jgi:hypothetical protein